MRTHRAEKQECSVNCALPHRKRWRLRRSSAQAAWPDGGASSAARTRSGQSRVWHHRTVPQPIRTSAPATPILAPKHATHERQRLCGQRANGNPPSICRRLAARPPYWATHCASKLMPCPARYFAASIRNAENRQPAVTTLRELPRRQPAVVERALLVAARSNFPLAYGRPRARAGGNIADAHVHTPFCAR